MRRVVPLLFFFSSRRRHTRSTRDWSSDVCSSDLALGLWALGVPYWLAFGIFTGLVAVVPFFGTMVSTLLPALVVVGTGDWLRVLAVIALGVAVHVLEANVVVPRIMQRQVSLPPVLTIASVLTMGTLIGVVGLVVAVPVLAVTMVVVRHIV